MNDEKSTSPVGPEENGEQPKVRVHAAFLHRPLRTINLIEQRDSSGRISWVLIEGSTTLFDMNEAELLHATSRQLFGVQPYQVVDTVRGHSASAFQHGVNCGRTEERQVAQDRARAAREAAVPTGDPADEILRSRGRDKKSKAPVIAKRAKKVAVRKPTGKVKLVDKRKKPVKKARAKRRN